MARALSNIVYLESPEKGVDGRGILSGARDPLMTDGRLGDFWINTVSKHLFGPKNAGEWPDKGLIRGAQGWAPVLVAEADGTRRVFKISDWSGGEGSKPTTGYLAADGTVVADIADAVDFRGADGPQALINALDAKTDAVTYSTLTALGEAASDNEKGEIKRLFEPGGSLPFPAVADAQGEKIPAKIKRVIIDGVNYVRTPAEPTHALKLRSADRWTTDEDHDSANGGYWQIDEPIVTPEMAGLIDYNVDNAGPINAAAAAAQATKSIFKLAQGETYRFSQLVLPDGLVVNAKGAILRALGGLSGQEDRDVFIGSDCVIDSLVLSHPGDFRANYYLVEVAGRTVISHLAITADIQTNNSGLLMSGDDAEIGTFEARKVDRPVFVYGTDRQTKGCKIHHVDIESYVRGVGARNHANLYIGPHRIVGRSPNVSPSVITPGQNGILLEGAPYAVIGDGVVEGAGEHAYRIGGSPGPDHTIYPKFGNLTAIRPRGCGFKCNPLGKNGGSNDYVVGLDLASITGVDVGDGQLGELGKQPDLLRMTSFKDARVGWAECHSQDQLNSCLAAVAINDGDGLSIGWVSATDTNSGLFVIRGDQDVLPGDEGGVSNVSIGAVTGTTRTNSGMTINTQQTVSGIFLDNVSISGYAVRLLALSDPLNVAGIIRLSGKSYGAVAPNILNAPTNDNVLLDWTHNGQRYTGPAYAWRVGVGSLQLVGQSVSLSSGPLGLYLNSFKLAAAANAYTQGLEFGRNGTMRLGAAIAGKHTDAANLARLGLAFLIKNGSLTASDQLVEGLVIDHDGHIVLPISGTGVVLTSPDGLTRKRLTIDNSGTPVWTTI